MRKNDWKTNPTFSDRNRSRLRICSSDSPSNQIWPWLGWSRTPSKLAASICHYRSGRRSPDTGRADIERNSSSAERCRRVLLADAVHAKKGPRRRARVVIHTAAPRRAAACAARKAGYNPPARPMTPVSSSASKISTPNIGAISGDLRQPADDGGQAAGVSDETEDRARQGEQGGLAQDQGRHDSQAAPADGPQNADSGVRSSTDMVVVLSIAVAPTTNATSDVATAMACAKRISAPPVT